MARPYTAKIGRHVTYWSTAGKPKPGTITAVTSNTVISMRFGRNGGTAASISRRATRTSPRNNVWEPT